MMGLSTVFKNQYRNDLCTQFSGVVGLLLRVFDF